MYYILYLSSLCRRRRWNDPLYKIYPTAGGYAATVNVNHREYRTEGTHATEDLAKEAVAMKAYLQCRNAGMAETQQAAMQAAMGQGAMGPGGMGPGGMGPGAAVVSVGNGGWAVHKT